ncbi:MAG: hypothetical protein M3323_07325 [Actinomycetota bacterium]|nr:hypothetical protein [Actinomycetota bacterium]
MRRGVGRGLAVAAMLYIAAAVRGLAKERSGELRCACEADCWCKKPGLSLFRWVFPFGHSLSD